jgi:hypothetical protein
MGHFTNYVVQVHSTFKLYCGPSKILSGSGSLLFLEKKIFFVITRMFLKLFLWTTKGVNSKKWRGSLRVRLHRKFCIVLFIAFFYSNPEFVYFGKRFFTTMMGSVGGREELWPPIGKDLDVVAGTGCSFRSGNSLKGTVSRDCSWDKAMEW